MYWVYEVYRPAQLTPASQYFAHTSVVLCQTTLHCTTYIAIALFTIFTLWPSVASVNTFLYHCCVLLTLSTVCATWRVTISDSNCFASCMLLVLCRHRTEKMQHVHVHTCRCIPRAPFVANRDNIAREKTKNPH